MTAGARVTYLIAEEEPYGILGVIVGEIAVPSIAQHTSGFRELSRWHTFHNDVREVDSQGRQEMIDIGGHHTSISTEAKATSCFPLLNDAVSQLAECLSRLRCFEELESDMDGGFKLQLQVSKCPENEIQGTYISESPGVLLLGDNWIRILRRLIEVDFANSQPIDAVIGAVEWHQLRHVCLMVRWNRRGQLPSREGTPKLPRLGGGNKNENA